MPLTASKTDANTIAAMRLVKKGLALPAHTVSFTMPTHSKGELAAAGLGVTAAPLSSKVQIAATPKNSFMDPSSWVRVILDRSGGESMDWAWAIPGLLPD